jgi:tRNA dimethylallyltransferase
MDIGTAKPTSEERQQVPHHLVDFLELDQPFTVADYQKLADKKIQEICGQGKQPLFVGGSGLYFRAIVDGLFDGPSADPKLRTELREEAQEFGREKLHQKLARIDPETAGRVHPNDIVRVIRALEVYEKTGEPISVLQSQWNEEPRYDFVAIALNRPRELLYQRIERRVDEMIEKGLVQEVKKLLELYPRDCRAMQCFGYREIASYLNGEIGIEEAIELTCRRTRKFSKRQLTWFRNDDRIRWFDLSKFKDVNEAAEELIREINS